MEKIIVIALLIISMKLNAQTNDAISIAVACDSVIPRNDSRFIPLVLECKNLTSQNFLLYGIDDHWTDVSSMEDICDVNKTSARFAIFLYNDKNERQNAKWRMSDLHYKPFPKDTLERRMRYHKERYLLGTRVINGNDTLKLEKLIDLQDYELKSGRYYVQIVYYSGKGVELAMVGKERVNRDKNEYHAELFQGCAISNRIMFRLE